MAQTAQKPQPRKVRWTLPAADTSVAEWLDAQENISESLRLLIREEIQRSGYVDIAYKPVEQLPRRGRPPKSETTPQDDQDDRPEQPRTPRSRAHPAQTAQPARPRLVEAAPAQAPAAVPEPEAEPVSEPAPAPGPEEERESAAAQPRPSATEGTQLDMNDIFGHNG